MRFSRPCYDKPHRCAGWAGGGMKYAKVDRCANGHIHVRRGRQVSTLDGTETYVDDYPASNPWRFGHCDRCDVITWPWATRKLDPTWWKYEIRSAIRWRIPQWWRTSRLGAEVRALYWSVRLLFDRDYMASGPFDEDDFVEVERPGGDL
jgi:hypothetical protein